MTERIFTKERLKELKRVATGVNEEQDGIRSFKCIYCYIKELDGN
jgi:hypothetical protein